MMNATIVMTNIELLANQKISYDLPKHPYIAILAIYSQSVTSEWQSICSDWIVKSEQCYWALAWGHECSIWDDALDYAYLEFCNYDLPEDDDYNFMTTWHEDQTLDEVIEFAKTYIASPLEDSTLEIILINIQ